MKEEREKEMHLNWLLSEVNEKVRSYYKNGEHEINMKFAKLNDSRWPVMTKKQAAMFVEAGLVRKEDVIDWEDIKHLTKDISKEL